MLVVNDSYECEQNLYIYLINPQPLKEHQIIYHKMIYKHCQYRETEIFQIARSNHTLISLQPVNSSFITPVQLLWHSEVKYFHSMFHEITCKP